MTGTLRNHFSRACNKRVNKEKEWKRKRVVKNTCESWSVRPGAFRREFDYTHSADSKFPVPRYRQFRRSKSATTRMIRKRAREDKFNRLADNLPEDNQTWYQAEEIEAWNNWVQELEKDSLVYQKELDEESKYANDYALVMKFGSDTVRLPNTFTYSNKYFATGDCLVRCIGGRWLLLPCDAVLDDLSYLYSDFAWEQGSIGELFSVVLPEDPLTADISGWLQEF